MDHKDLRGDRGATGDKQHPDKTTTSEQQKYEII